MARARACSLSRCPRASCSFSLNPKDISENSEQPHEMTGILISDGKEANTPGGKKGDTHSRSSTSSASGDARGSVVVRTQSARVLGPRIAFTASRKVRSDRIPSGSGGELIIRLEQQAKVKSVLQILSVASGDGRRVLDEKSANAPLADREAARSAAAASAGEGVDADAEEEGRFSCMCASTFGAIGGCACMLTRRCRYWASQQSARDAKMGTLIVTSDRISFEIASATCMSCFIYEVCCM